MYRQTNSRKGTANWKGDEKNEKNIRRLRLLHAESLTQK
jgi:hypothetical protein